MANTLLTGQILCNEYLRCLDAKLTLGDGPTLGDMQGRVMIGTGRSGVMIGTGRSTRDSFRAGDICVLRKPRPFRPFSFGFDLRDIVTEELVAVPLIHQPRNEFPLDPYLLRLSVDQVGRVIFDTNVSLFGRLILQIWRPGVTMVVAPLEIPPGLCDSFRAVHPDSGLSVRFIQGYDAVNDAYACRVEMLFGVTGERVAVAYQPTPLELEMIALLLEAKSQYQLQLQELRRSA